MTRTAAQDPSGTGPLATVIVPVHNVESYITECLDSLLRQTYPNIEVLVVDDGSTDDTASAVHSAMSHDARVHLFRNKNRGVSYSRNFGIDRAQGAYLLFVDGDDVVAPDFVEVLVEILDSARCDSAVVGFSDLAAFGHRVADQELKRFTGEDVVASLFGDCHGIVCNKAYRAEMIRAGRIRFNEGISQSEDMLFNLDYLSRCESVGYRSGVRYGYRQRSGSATNDLDNLRWFDVLHVFDEFVLQCEGHSHLSAHVRRGFLPIAYEGLYRYRLLGAEDLALLQRLEQMRRWCEYTPSEFSLAFRIKMFVFRHFTGVVMWRRQRRV